MASQKRLHTAFASISVCACLAQFQAPSQAPFACNLSAFQPQERERWRKLTEAMISSVSEARELKDGYALKINTGKVSLVEAAEWIGLERRCCPFFDFQLDLRGEDGTLWLSLKGPEGVKQFILQEFTMLRGKVTGR